MKDLLRISDLARHDLGHLLARAEEFHRDCDHSSTLARRTVPLYFERPSTRTRLAVSAAVARLGGVPVSLPPYELRTGAGTTLEDAAEVVSLYGAVIVARFLDHLELERFAGAASVPVLNAMTDLHDPLQAIADLVTLREHVGGLEGVRLAYVGDGTNVANSLVEAGALAGMVVRVATPAGYEPDEDAVRAATRAAEGSGGEVYLTHDPQRAVEGAAAVYTDAWVDIEEPDIELGRRLETFAPYRVDDALMAAAAPGAVLLHCLPAQRGREVAADVLDGPRSLVVRQAENRMYAAQSLLDALVAGQLQGRAATPQPAAAGTR